ncbi:hypothetical protein ACE3MZ_12835 [Paenibacillus sp. WLX1005]|uniref:hypothetical protein n=1 Tax=Paenibacillus sp. WLX1005 TaxID=3243766 RepID=UPI003983FC3F
MPLNIELKLDFNSDWKEYLLMQFQHYGYELTEKLINKDVAEIAIMYHNFQLRRINISPREVHISKIQLSSYV